METFEKRLGHWTFRLLSLGGRLTLLNVVLVGIHIYWLSLAQVPKTILKWICRIVFNFLWSRIANEGKLQMASWERLSKPKVWDSWDIKNIY